MPPTGKLTEQQISNLTAWVRSGASWPDEKSLPSPLPVSESGHEAPKYSKEQLAFWSFQPIKVSSPPAVQRKDWAKTPIDNFILARLEKEGLEPARPADKLTLLRRATFDLTGLPPTEKSLQDFLSDDSPQAFDKVVERLLASERYGERWGRHWLDVARYGTRPAATKTTRFPTPGATATTL